MGKTAVMVLMLMLILSSLVNAEIRTRIDKFTGNEICESRFSDIPEGAISLRKSNNEYEINFWEFSIKGERFTREPLLMKINDNIIYQLVVDEEVQNRATSEIMDISVTAKVPLEVVNKILSANRIALKIFKDKGNPVVIVLPQKAISEWKQVIEQKE